MKEMKKILSVGLIIMLLLSMTACSAAASDQPATSSASDPTSVATESLATTLMTIPTKNPTTTATKMPTAAVTQTFSTAPVTMLHAVDSSAIIRMFGNFANIILFRFCKNSMASRL